MKNACSMKHAVRTISAVLAFILTFNQFAHAAKPSRKLAAAQAASARDVAAAQAFAPVPSQIASARKVFLYNAGKDENFPMSADQNYTDVYNALQSWGRYQLVGSPAEADLVFQLRGIAPITDITGNHGTVYSIASPAFQLTIVDPKTNSPLWTLTSPVTLAGKKQVLAKWQAVAVTNLVSRIKVVAGQPLSTVESNDLNTVPKNHRALVIALALGIPVLLFVGGFIIAKHKSDEFATEHGLTCATNPFFCTNP